MNSVMFSYILFINILCYLNVNVWCIESFDASSSDDQVGDGSFETRKHRAGRANLIAFKPFGKDIGVGLDLALPFVKVPSRRSLNERDEPLVTVNTAALTLGGIISGLGVFLGHILRSFFTLRGRESLDIDSRDTETKSSSVRDRLDFDAESGRFARILQPIKLVYRNSSGSRIDTSIADLISIVGESIGDSDFDLNACMQKAICSLVQRSISNVERGEGTGMERTIDGFLHLNWIMGLAKKFAIDEAILVGKSHTMEQCILKYPSCKWDAPEEQFIELIKKRMEFI